MCRIFVKRKYLRVCWRSTIDLCLMNLPKRSSLKSVLKVYTLSKILLWIKPLYFFFGKWVLLLVHASNRVVARRPLWHKVNLPASCKAQRLLCHRVNLPSCLARLPLFHKVNLPRCEARRHHFIMTCDIFGTGQTNILAWQVKMSDRINSSLPRRRF